MQPLRQDHLVQVQAEKALTVSGAHLLFECAFTVRPGKEGLLG
jgi:hypothetical protein